MEHTIRQNEDMLGADGDLSGLHDDVLESCIALFYDQHKPELMSHISCEAFLRGAYLAQDSFNRPRGITPNEEAAVREEETLGLWQQTKELKTTILITACAAITQGWQQSVINSSTSGWKAEFLPKGSHTVLVGIINAAPWISGSIIGAWLSDPLQRKVVGRRPALFVAALFCVATMLGSAYCRHWQQLLVCRVLLGIGIGTKASIAPVFAAEVAVKHLRGRLLLMWQLFDAFGIFLGFVCALLANALITKNGWVTTESWRVMLATASIPPIVLLVLVFISPESPRFLIRTGKYSDAYKSLLALRGAEILASRDLYSIHHQLEREERLTVNGPESRGIIRHLGYLKRTWNLFANPRNRRTCQSAFLVMMTQQLCGINVLTIYSSQIFKSLETRASASDWFNFGLGLANFLFTLPAYEFIDFKGHIYQGVRFRGRRFLLLVSLFGMTFSLLAASLCFRIESEHVRVALVIALTLGPFIFFYSIGAGPVPFTFSAEVFSIEYRDVGMSFSVMVNFLGLGLLVLVTPIVTPFFGPKSTETVNNSSSGGDLVNRFHQSNFLLLFVGLNVLAFIAVYLIVSILDWLSDVDQFSDVHKVPSTSEATLEQTPALFEKRTRDHAYFQVHDMSRWMYEYYILRRNIWEPQFMEADRIKRPAGPREFMDMRYGQTSWPNGNGQAYHNGPLELESVAPFSLP